MSKYRLILIDTLILCMVSTVLAVVFNFTVDKLKGEVKKDDPIVIASERRLKSLLDEFVERLGNE